MDRRVGTAPDISIAPLPREALLHGARPLTLGRADGNKPVFSLGYTSGFSQLNDFLPLSGELPPQEGYGSRLKRQLLAGEDAAAPFLFSGYCGSPVLQQQGNRWNVVGMHVGSCVVPGVPAENKAFAVNLDKVIPQLLHFYRNHVLPAPRELRFNNQPVDNLTYTEQVWLITVSRNNEVVL
ncbi:MAG: hypothetical protein MJ053_04185, partial [Elusimicrobiaceae bacterium]|nr:hypothetical protein [Elusimicrobiaceae bacterium]